MPVDAGKLLKMSDEELTRWTLSGEAGSEASLVGQAVLNMRVATRNLESSREMVNQTRQWVEANLELDTTTRSLVRATRGIALATWGVVLITLVTQIALLYLALIHK
jgi:hypothetical protein